MLILTFTRPSFCYTRMCLLLSAEAFVMCDASLLLLWTLIYRPQVRLAAQEGRLPNVVCWKQSVAWPALVTSIFRKKALWPACYSSSWCLCSCLKSMIGESMDLPTQALALGYLSLSWGFGTILGKRFPPFLPPCATCFATQLLLIVQLMPVSICIRPTDCCNDSPAMLCGTKQRDKPPG